MLSASSRSRSAVNIWPGFVDALASVLLVFIFMLLMFVLAQFVLTDVATSRFGAIEQLSGNVSALLDELSLEKQRAEDLDRRVANLSRELDTTRSERDATAADLRDARAGAAASRAEAAALTADIAALRGEVDRSERAIGDLRARNESLDQQAQARGASLADALDRDREARARIERLTAQIGALREQLAGVASALELSQGRNEEFRIQVEELGQKLNVALAERVEELGRFRSEFFGRLREALGSRSDVRITGDRFVFPSEVLFPSGSAELEPDDRARLDRLAETLSEVAAQIPKDVDWILRVDGHTDRRPISTAEFPSNWELSTARALSIVRHLIAAGIEPRRLAATGFGEFRPIDPGSSPEALARNRRIELKLTGP